MTWTSIRIARQAGIPNTILTQSRLIVCGQDKMLSLLFLASGVLVHLSVFRHGEWETKSPQVVLSYLIAALGGTLSLRASNSTAANDESGIGPTGFVRLLAFHMIGLFTSITVYRLFFHKLSGFRGPFIARLSSFYLAWLSAKRLHLHDEIDVLHSRYGDYVRTGNMFVYPLDTSSHTIQGLGSSP